LIDEGQAIDGEFEDHAAIRVWSLSLKFKVLTLVLKPKIGPMQLQGILRGTKNGSKFKVRNFF
jgi:hypothetical protein